MSGLQPAPDAAAPGPAIVEVSGVSKRFGMSQALSDVSMRVPAGDSRALVGRNGARQIDAGRRADRHTFS